MTGRVLFFLLTLAGIIYASAGLFSSLLDVALGLIACCVGLIGWGWIDYRDRRHDAQIMVCRDHVWERRKKEWHEL